MGGTQPRIRSQKWRKVVAVTFMVFAVCSLVKGAEPVAPEAEKPHTQWLDTFPKHVGFTWNAEMGVMANYMWRGMYVGGLSFQAAATIGYGGAFFSTWWNVGATNWKFDALCPEVDLSIGFARWGFFILLMEMYYFDTYADGTPSRFFDWANHDIGGVTTELRLGYKVSSKIPLSILWCTRFWGRDGYRMPDGELKRAYSTYIELGYDFNLPYDLVLQARLGMTPWKSGYTGFVGDFAVTNIDLTLRHDWQLTDYCRLRVFGELMFNPWRVNKENIKWDVAYPWNQRLNANVGMGVYFN